MARPKSAQTDQGDIAVLIPVYNEEKAIGRVLSEVPDVVGRIVIVDNGCTDDTVAVARQSDKRVHIVNEPVMGYGRACLAGLEFLAQVPPHTVIFLDGDYSDSPGEMTAILAAMEDNDMVIGSRVLGNREPGALLPQARFGNWLASRLIILFYGHRYTDLGPFRAITWQGLQTIGMQDTSFGWTVEMQVKAVKAGLRVAEVPVSYKKRIGKSKVSGTVKGTILAGYFIVTTIFRYMFWKP